ncbi:MAG: radical SAM protein [Desulfobacteraceae bacterium]
MILVYPPVSKSCEPPAGIALLAGALKSRSIQATVVDANIEALMWLGQNAAHPGDSWTRRALSHYSRNLSDLKEESLYRNNGRYRQRVMDVNRVITTSLPERFRVTLADYSDGRLSPVESGDLLRSGEKFSENPFFGYFERCLAGRIENAGSQWVGISLCFLSQALTAFALAGWVKSRFPEKKIVMGGGLVTSWMSSPQWHNPFESLINTMVKGEGEEIIGELAAESGTVPQEMAGGIIDTTTYLPDFEFCPWDLYLAPGRVLPYRTAIGCYWGKCRFCPEKAEQGRYRTGKNREIMAQLEEVTARCSADYVHFLDNALSPAFLRNLASRNSASFLWYGFVRFSKELADPGFCRKLYRSGCRMLKLGLESGDQGVLDKMKKGTDLDTASRVLACLTAAGIKTYVYLLFGTSFENEASAQKTLNYVEQHSDKISFLNTAIFNLPRFSCDAEHLETRAFYSGDLSLYSGFNHPEQWDRRRVRQFLDKQFKKNPSIASVLRNDPPFFSSSHALFVE